MNENTNNNSNNQPDENIDEIIRILDEYKPDSKKKVKENGTGIDDNNSSTEDEQPTRIGPAVTEHFTEVIDTQNIKKGDDMTIHFVSVDEDSEQDSDEDENTESSKLEKLPKKRKKKRRGGAFGVFSSIFKTIMYLVFVLGVSAYVSYNVVMIGNDVFAFVKNDTEKTVTVSEDMTYAEVAKMLKDEGIIQFDWVFELYAENRAAGKTFLNGDFVVKANMNYDEILTKLTVVIPEREIVKITIPEGYTTDQIIDLLVANGIGDRDKYIEVINNYQFKHEFMQVLNEIELSPDRRYRLEGYMFPDTYFFYKDDDEVTVINKMLNNFEVKFQDSFYERCDELGMTMDDVIILASIVEAEAKFSIDLEYISSVFHNRLNSTEFTKLESDATIQYFLEEHKDTLTSADLAIDNPYNTYLYEGLPPGAISNPGIDAITAALWPDDPIDSNGYSFKAYYFVSNLYGQTYYAQTNRGHEQNKAQVKEDNEEYYELYNTDS